MVLSKRQKVIFLFIMLMIVMPTIFNAEPLYADLWGLIWNAATKVFDKVKDAVDKVVETAKDVWDTITNIIWNIKNLIKEKDQENQAPVIGDPVLVTSGQFYLKETDADFPGSSFTLDRTYLSEAAVVGSFGRGWSSSLDSRILRSKTDIPEEELNRLNGEVGNTGQAAEEAAWINDICTLDINTLEQSELIREIIEANGEVYNLNELKKELENMDMQGFSDDMAKFVGEIDGMQQGVEQEYRNIQDIAGEAEKIGKLNNLVMFEGTPEKYFQAGNGNLVLINEIGTPVLFEFIGNGEWQPQDELNRLTMNIKSRDGRDVNTKAGFILRGAGGIKSYYNGYGLLEAVEELNGNRIELARNEQGYVTRIRGPHSNEWKINNSPEGLIMGIEDPVGQKVQYQYTGKYLTKVTDHDGSIVQYMYEETRLKKITKTDGSYIEITYGVERDGKKLVTAAQHEEGQSEYFDYFTRRTVHTNHSGVVTTYTYNDKHQITMEEYSDGTVKTFSYNELGQIERETVNGFEMRYSYDGRGNIILKTYGDGTREEWQWDGNDQATRYVDKDGVVQEWTYDGAGNCTSVRKGGQMVFSGLYGERGKLLESREGDRTLVRWTYDSRDFQVSKSFDVIGRTITEKLEYDALGRIVKYADGAGRTWQYGYGASFERELSPEGLETTRIYNKRKDLIAIVERDTITGEKREKRAGYDKRHLILEETDGAGVIRKYQYRADAKLVKREQGPWYWEYGYDAAGRISTVTRGMAGSDKRYVEVFGYKQEGWNEERTITKPLCGTTTYKLNQFEQITGITNALGEHSTRTLNSAGEILREQGEAGGFYTYLYDAAGRLIIGGREGENAIQVKYNSDGTIAEWSDRLGNITRHMYDGRGLLIKETKALGEKRYQYDEAGRVTRIETASRNSGIYYTERDYNDAERTVTVTLGGTYKEKLFFNAWGEIIKRIDGENNETRFDYDGAGRIIKAIDGYGRETSYSWNELGKIAQVTYADEAIEQYEYDHMENMTGIRDALGVVWTGEYDEAGRLSKETGRPGISKEYKYDALGRIVEIKEGGDITEKYQYTNRGREAAFTDGTGRNFIRRKNEYGDHIEDINRVGDSQRYVYDAEGNQTAHNAFSGKRWSIEYRAAEGINVITYSDGTQSVIEKDMAGNILRASDKTGTIRYRYDAGGKLIEQNDEGAGEVTRYAYDRAGRKTRMQSGDRVVNYHYGKNGELLRVQDAGRRLEANYEYDARGRETKRVYGNGVRQETAYDMIGRVILIRETDPQNRLLRAEGYLYDDKGRRSHIVDEDGKITKYEYDNQSRLKTVLYPWTQEKADTDRKEAEEAGLYFTADKGSGERYAFSGTEITALRNILNLASPSRGNVLQISQMAWRETYSYDMNGNRITKTTPWGIIKYEYDLENRLIRKGDVEYTNDKDGNILSEKGARYEAKYEYNGQNRMVYSEVTNHSAKTHSANTYTYDALGRRTLTQNITGQTMRTVYDGRSFEVIREGETFRDGSLTTQYASSLQARGGNQLQSNTLRSNEPTGERYRWIGENGGTTTATGDGYAAQGGRYGARGVTLYGNGEAVAVSYSSSVGSRSFYLGKDITGSVKSAIGDLGSIEGRYEYDAFGQPYKGDLSGGMNLGYTGKPYDTATGLYYYGYRDYNPQLARFTTVDPIRDGSNWYAYVNNDPVNWIDPWGLTGVDLNLFRPGEFLHLGEFLYYMSQTIYHPPNTFIIAGHGDEDKDGIIDDKGSSLSAEDLVTLMYNNGYVPGTPVILFSCNTGKVKPDGTSFAQDLADALADYARIHGGETKTVVYAPDDYISALPGGFITKGPNLDSSFSKKLQYGRITRDTLRIMTRFKGR